MKKKLNIVYEDRELVVINKPSGLLTVSTEKENEKTLYREVSDYEKTKHKSNKVFIINRLDKDTSGIVMFAKNQKIKKLFQDNWNELVKTRNYIAIVEGKTNTEGTIKSWLKETKTFLTYSSNKENDGKLAITTYKKIKNNNKYTLLNIEIFTGRKNQIRVHMKDINHPIVGDKKYGSKVTSKRMMLHANLLEVYHPINKKLYIFECECPKEFKTFF